MAKLPYHFISGKFFQKDQMATLVGISLSPAPPFGWCWGKASFYFSLLVKHTWTSTTCNIVREDQVLFCKQTSLIMLWYVSQSS